MKKHLKSITLNLRVSKAMDNFLKKKVKDITKDKKIRISKGELIRCFIYDQMEHEVDIENSRII